MDAELYKKKKDEITDWDKECFNKLTRLDLSQKQKETVINPSSTYPDVNSVLAVHWHPENVPIELILQRIKKLYPNSTDDLIIPTQHNELMIAGEYAGVEVDCYSPEFKRKVQLLFHFNKKHISAATKFKAMLRHTFSYRSSQFYQFLETATKGTSSKLFNEAVSNTAIDENIASFVVQYANKLKELIYLNKQNIPDNSLKNKLLVNYFQTLIEFFDSQTINKSLLLLAEIKRLVKQNFQLDYFYYTNDMIEEVRGLNGCIVIPHPEQFWPILLANYDIDGIEVWNPQSREYTEFLIDVVAEKNKTTKNENKKILVFMGDDTHFSEKTKEEHLQFKNKAMREIGYQPPWDDLIIRKKIIASNLSKPEVIKEYRNRLNVNIN